MVEQPIRNRQVVGSTPTLGSNFPLKTKQLRMSALIVLSLALHGRCILQTFRIANPSRLLAIRSRS